MKYFTTIHDLKDPTALIDEAVSLKKKPFAFDQLGKNKTLGLIFFNPSLRTRLSTQKAAQNLGLNVICMNIGQEGWALEYNDGTVMNGSSVEHIKDAAAIIGIYCDIIGVRTFAGLQNREDDYKEKTLLHFMKHCNKPIVSLESATLHPLQSLADCVTIKENTIANKKPKIVLSWAPHIKALPQAVANSFSEWMLNTGAELTIVQPKGYELCEDFTKGALISYNQEEALKDADFVYAKNWSPYNDYGKLIPVEGDWIINNKKMQLTNDAKFMHCMPVRRNLEIHDEVLDGKNSLIMQQADNRLYAAQAVLKNILETN